jgi:tetratricopeptide (TPR) repeat protein
MTKLQFTYKTLLAGLLICLCQSTFAQTGNKYIRKGNELYKNKKYTDAEANYKKALEVNQQSVEGRYNLGNSLYEQKRYDDARSQYANSFKMAPTREGKGDASYNIGNTYMEGKKWEESIKAYKEALKQNPTDEQARYNLAYAQAMLKKQQGGGGDNNKDKKDKDKNQQNKDQQNKNKQDENKDKQDENKDKNKNKNKEEQDEKPEPQPSKLNKQEAERLLQALGQEENKLQDKMKKAKGQAVPVDKDW